MVTDDERRRVAAKLRSLAGGYVTIGEMEHALGICMSSPIVDLERDARDLHRLADLIEPNRGSGGRTILCAHCESASWCGCEPGDEEGGCDFEPSVTEGEPPYNLYSLYEAVLRRRPRDEYAIDDDEVDELVDALLDICNAPGYERIQRPQPSCDRDALLALADELEAQQANKGIRKIGPYMQPGEAARRIREACGEAGAKPGGRS